jgi:hypothetical protein
MWRSDDLLAGSVRADDVRRQPTLGRLPKLDLKRAVLNAQTRELPPQRSVVVGQSLERCSQHDHAVDQRLVLYAVGHGGVHWPSLSPAVGAWIRVFAIRSAGFPHPRSIEAAGAAFGPSISEAR